MCILLAHNSRVSRKTFWATQIHEETWQKLIRPLPNVDGCLCYTVLGVYNDALFNIFTITLTLTFTVSRKISGKYKQQLVSIHTVFATMTGVRSCDTNIRLTISVRHQTIFWVFTLTSGQSLIWPENMFIYTLHSYYYTRHSVNYIFSSSLVTCHEAIHTLSKQGDYYFNHYVEVPTYLFRKYNMYLKPVTLCKCSLVEYLWPKINMTASYIGMH